MSSTKTCSACKETKCISLYYKGKNQCKECYSHKKIKAQCRECDGGAYCSHNKIKTTCRECRGSAFCSHNVQKSQCRECGGSAYCSHNVQKAQCRKCCGSAFCKHNIQKYTCRDCCGSAFCKHDKIKSQCRECGGSAFCSHDKIKSQCRDCGGSIYCSHNIQKAQCIICCPSRACKECKSVLVNKKSTCYPLCQSCFCNAYPDHEKSTLYKIKERYLRDELRVRFPDKDINMIFDKAVDGGCSKKRPDVLIDLLLYSIIIECDENQHKNYECENKRTMQLFEDLGNRPLVFIRFNPDDYINNGVKI